MFNEGKKSRIESSYNFEWSGSLLSHLSPAPSNNKNAHTQHTHFYMKHLQYTSIDTLALCLCFCLCLSLSLRMPVYYSLTLTLWISLHFSTLAFPTRSLCLYLSSVLSITILIFSLSSFHTNLNDHNNSNNCENEKSHIEWTGVVLICILPHPIPQIIWQLQFKIA